MRTRSVLRVAPLVLCSAAVLAACAERITTGASPLEPGAPRLTVTPTTAFTVIDAGRNHTCGLASGGQAYCWGQNSSGQLGDSTAASTTVPVAVYQPGLSFAQITGGNVHTCALTSTGAAYCWGYNPDARLGDSTFVNPLRPVPVTTNVAFASLSAGGAHTCGLNSSGQAYCWGNNVWGQIGDSTTVSPFFPKAVQHPAGVTFTQINAAENNTCALDTNGQAYCWGYGGDSGIGNGSTSSQRIPTAVSQGVVTYTQISTTYKHACGLTSTGQAYCWGFNGQGQLGDNTTTNRSSPVAVQQGAVTFASIHAGGNQTCALDASGNAYCWGDDTYGQLGNGATAGSLTPVAVTMPSGVTFAQIQVGGVHACGRDGSVGQSWCQGRNNFGQIGDGTNTNRNVPTATSH